MFGKIVERIKELIPSGMALQYHVLPIHDGYKSHLCLEGGETAQHLGFDILLLEEKFIHFLQCWDRFFGPMMAFHSKLSSVAIEREKYAFVLINLHA